MWKHFNVSKEDSKIIKEEAQKYSELRTRCKKFLEKNNMKFDKFTVVNHDSHSGYISEKYVLDYIQKLSGFKIRNWGEMFSADEINRILELDKPKLKEIRLIKEFFYDKYDIEMSYGLKRLFIDVKSAKTKKKPQIKWNFLYPKSQANKNENSCVVLTYLVYNKEEDLESVYIMGAADYKDILNSEIQKAGSVTKFNTKSRVDNYVTELSIYKELNNYIDTFFE
ncbi:hypothetical protein ACWOBP_00835 [Gemella parahaemolysans]